MKRQWVIVQLAAAGSRLVHTYGPFDSESDAQDARDAFYGQLTAVVELERHVPPDPDGAAAFKAYLREREAATDLGPYVGDPADRHHPCPDCDGSPAADGIVHRFECPRHPRLVRDSGGPNEADQ